MDGEKAAFSPRFVANFSTRREGKGERERERVLPSLAKLLDDSSRRGGGRGAVVRIDVEGGEEKKKKLN